MDNVSLRLCTPLKPGRVNLVFRAGDPCTSRLPRLTGHIDMRTLSYAGVDASMPSIQGALGAIYDHAVWRGVARIAGDLWQQARPEPATASIRHQDGARVRVVAGIPLGNGARLIEGHRAPHGEHAPLRQASVIPWQAGAEVGLQRSAPYQTMATMPRPRLAQPWQRGQDASRSAHAPWQERHRRPRPLPLIAWQLAMPRTLAWTGPQQPARPHWRHWLAPWGEGADQFGWGGPWSPPPGPPEPPYAGCYPAPHSTDLAFFFGLAQDRHHLRFFCPDKTRIVPRLRSYIVINDITLTRVADTLALPCLTLSLTLDADSWVVGFRASLPGSVLDDVIGDAGSPVELEARINGISFRLYAEKVSRARSFGQARISVSGRGRAAVLDAPYAPVMRYASADALTAQQAAEAALTAAGLPTGWSIDWQLTDWLLPAGLWAHQGSPISALIRIAQAAGGYLQADPIQKIIHMLPRYPIAPWNWPSAEPDIILPDAVALTEGIEWQDKPDYNAVYISGATGGILGHVKRAGSAGDKVAQMLTDDLITHADAARQRGTAILADTGRQARINLSLPVLPGIGIILPGQLLRLETDTTPHIGITRSLRLEASLPRVRQTVEIETHA